MPALPQTPTPTTFSAAPQTPAPLPDRSKVNMAAVEDSSHPDHHFSLGQFISLALLGLSAYNQQNKPGSGPAIFLDPKVLSPYLQGVLSLFPNL